MHWNCFSQFSKLNYPLTSLPQSKYTSNMLVIFSGLIILGIQSYILCAFVHVYTSKNRMQGHVSSQIFRDFVDTNMYYHALQLSLHRKYKSDALWIYQKLKYTLHASEANNLLLLVSSHYRRCETKVVWYQPIFY